MSRALNFYITVSTEPIQPVENYCGCCAYLVLVGAPSHKSSKKWAEDFAKKNFIDVNHNQNLKEITIVPISNSILSAKGREKIVWSQLSKHIQETAKDTRHEFEMFSSGGLFIPTGNDTPARPKDWDNPKRLRALVSKEYRDQMNWNESYPAFFVYHDAKKAIIVKGSNSIVASIPFVKDTGDDKPSGPQISLHYLSVIEQYQ